MSDQPKGNSPRPRPQSTPLPERVDPATVKAAACPPGMTPEQFEATLKRANLQGRRVRIPSHVEMAHAGLPQDLVQHIKEGCKTGWMIAAWRLTKKWEPGGELPGFELKLVRRDYPYDLLLRSLQHIRKLILDIDPTVPADEEEAVKESVLEEFRKVQARMKAMGIEPGEGGEEKKEGRELEPKEEDGE